MQNFTDLMAAIRILRDAQKQTLAYANGPWNNPAWDKIAHALNYLGEQVAEVL